MENLHAWHFTEVIPTLNVTDLGKATAWYGNLGFESDWFYPSEGNATHAGLVADKINLMLALCNDPPERIQKQNLYFRIENIKAFRDNLAKHYSKELPSLTESDYGMRDFSITDPWGHLLTFGEKYE